jgi:hypothetical protein
MKMNIWLLGTTIITGTIVLSVPTLATEAEDAKELCLDAAENHPEEPEWKQACLDAVAELLPAPSTPETQPRQIFPIAKTEISRGSHAGDRDLILQRLQSEGSQDILVELEVSTVRTELQMRSTLP